MLYLKHFLHIIGETESYHCNWSLIVVKPPLHIFLSQINPHTPHRFSWTRISILISHQALDIASGYSVIWLKLNPWQQAPKAEHGWYESPQLHATLNQYHPSCNLSTLKCNLILPSNLLCTPRGLYHSASLILWLNIAHTKTRHQTLS